MLSDNLEKFRAQFAKLNAELQALAIGQDDATMAALIRNVAGAAWAAGIAVHDIKRHALRAEATSKSNTIGPSKVHHDPPPHSSEANQDGSERHPHQDVAHPSAHRSVRRTDATASPIRSGE